MIIAIMTEFCKACGFCMDVCKRNVLATGTETNSRGYRAVVAEYPERCVGCSMCALVCPEGAVGLEK